MHVTFNNVTNVREITILISVVTLGGDIFVITISNCSND